MQQPWNLRRWAIEWHKTHSLQGKQLEKKEAELKALDAFYKEQITNLEKKVGVFLSVWYSFQFHYIFLHAKYWWNGSLILMVLVCKWSNTMVRHLFHFSGNLWNVWLLSSVFPYNFHSWSLTFSRNKSYVAEPQGKVCISRLRISGWLRTCFHAVVVFSASRMAIVVEDETPLFVHNSCCAIIFEDESTVYPLLPRSVTFRER